MAQLFVSFCGETVRDEQLYKLSYQDDFGNIETK